MSIEGGRVGESCKRGGPTVKDGCEGGSSSNVGKFEDCELWRGGAPSLLDIESARRLVEGSRDAMVIESSMVGIE